MTSGRLCTGSQGRPASSRVTFHSSKVLVRKTSSKISNKAIPFCILGTNESNLGSCSISSRNQKANWQIDDEEEFIVVLQEAKKAGEDIDNVLEEATVYTIIKKEANKLLDAWEQSGKLKGFLSKAVKGKEVISKSPSKTTVAFKFVEKEEKEEDDVMDISIPVKGGSSSTEDYDTL